MDIHRNPQEIDKFYANQLEINRNLWKSIEIHRKFIEIDGNSLEINENLLKSIEINWKSMGNLWESMELREKSIEIH